MSFPHGTDLGGIRTLERLRERCFVDESTGCWHWRMAISQGAPRVQFSVDGRNRISRGPSAARRLAGKPVGAMSWVVCGHADCVNPAHTRTGTRKEHGAHLRKTGAAKTPAKAQHHSRRLTAAQIVEIRSSSEAARVLAERFGVCGNVIWRARHGQTYKEVGAPSVFAWRPGTGT